MTASALQELRVDRILDALDPEQRSAATLPDGPAQIIAPAGSGKTTTMVARLAVLLARGVAPDRTCVVTFNRDAAHDLAARVERRLTAAAPAIEPEVLVCAYRAYAQRVEDHRTDPVLAADVTSGCPREVFRDLADNEDGVQNELTAQLGSEGHDRARSQLTQLPIPPLPTVAVEEVIAEHERIRVPQELPVSRHLPERLMEPAWVSGTLIRERLQDPRLWLPLPPEGEWAGTHLPSGDVGAIRPEELPRVVAAIPFHPGPVGWCSEPGWGNWTNISESGTPLPPISPQQSPWPARPVRRGARSAAFGRS